MLFCGSSRSGCSRRCGRSAGANDFVLPIIGHIRKLPVFRPVPAIITALGTVTSCYLDTVFPLRCAFYGQTAADVNTDMPLAPHGFAHFNLGEIRGHTGTLGNHRVGSDVRHTVDGVTCTAVALRPVTRPAP